MSAFHRSIRWRIQAWYGLLLLALLVAFGTTSWWLVRDNHLRRVDQELQRRLAVVAAAIRPTPPRSMGGGPVPALVSTAEQEALFAGPSGGKFYYAIWYPEGTILQASSNAPPGTPAPERGRGQVQGTVRSRGDFREASLIRPVGMGLGPRGMVAPPRLVGVVVGCSMLPEWAELRRTAWMLVAAGAGVLVLGLAVGWWLAARAIRPVAAISATARSISDGNLAERINLTETDSELGQLAVVLNRSFDQLQAAMARQVQFTADASHELRTPLAVILSQTQTALKRERTPDEYREALAASQRAAQRMTRLTESLMLLARLDGGHRQAFQPVRLDQVVGDVVQLLRPLAEEKGIALKSDLAPLCCPGDEGLLHQLVSNLVSNAIRYNRPAGIVALRLAEDQGAAMLQIADTGPGIGAEDLPHIFDRFYRADAARSRADGGSGLGLGIAAAVARAHGGTLEATSEVGVGATFTLRLPLAGDEDDTGQPGAATGQGIA